MKVYRLITRLSKDEEAGEHKGYSFYEKRRHAVQDLAEQPAGDIEEYDIPVTKAGLLGALNLLASHPDNG